MMTFGSLFSGIGGFDLGFERAGLTCLWQCEADRACRSILRRHFPAPTLYPDVRTLSRPAAVDVLLAGFPCQDLSVAGLRAGLAGARSGLWWQFRRVARQLRPRFFVLENVPGLLSSAQGRDFAVLLRGLAKLGYRLAWRVLDSQYDRVAQRRRVFIVGSLGDGRCAEILFEPESLRWDSAPRRDQTQSVAGTLEASSDRHRGSGINSDLLTYAIQAGATRENPASGPDGIGVQESIAYTLEARAEVQSIALARCVMSGEGRRNDYDTCTLVTAPLTTRPYADHQSKESLLITGTISARTQGGGGLGTDSDLSGGLIAHTLRAEGDGNDPGVPLVPAYGISPDCLDRSGEGAGGTAAERSGLGILTEQSPTIRAKRPGAVAGKMGVRRLTPRECERLQAFPDHWTRWTDTDREQKDGPRYK